MSEIFCLNPTTPKAQNILPCDDCGMCKICNLVKQFPHVKLGEQHYYNNNNNNNNNNIDIVMDSKCLEFLGYTMVRFVNEMIDSGDDDYDDNYDEKDFFEKVLGQKGCNTPICKEFLDSWKIIMEGICKFIDGENLIELPNDELIIFGYKWASYDLKSEKDEIDLKIAEQTRLLEDESRKFHELINKICE